MISQKILNKIFPKELILYIWSFDNKYHKIFKDCIYEMKHYFNKNRLVNRFEKELYSYNIYIKMLTTTIPYRYTPSCYYSPCMYILKKLKFCGGDVFISEYLNHHNLKRIRTRY